MTGRDDALHMRHAVALASRGVGRTGRVPSVGCVIVAADGRILGRGRTDECGRPHAEIVALQMAGQRARGATAYVTLEPCSHIGTTGGPCADALIAAGLARVVIACGDPDPRVDGQGIARLRAAGIAVEIGIGEREAAATLAGFFSHIRRQRPYVTLKIAQSLDGKTATAAGDSKWITGEAARRFGHLLRARNDAILIGANTASADDPDLTCRLAGLEGHSPLRVVLDSRLRLRETSRLATSALRHPTLVFTTVGGGDALKSRGVDVVVLPPDARGRPDLGAMLTELSKRNVTRLLVEGGATVHAAFLDGGFADELEVFTAPIVLGGAAHGSIAALSALRLGEAPKFTRLSVREFGADLLESYSRTA
ncbi:MAG TPA: bifunctional diaminohydroxyphosphoribosylaminopyrimidine deaminase/5-amino-6-(5-phosphoribosylamino)uracil reductase RibD [Rhizomicrobium sp.]